MVSVIDRLMLFMPYLYQLYCKKTRQICNADDKSLGITTPALHGRCCMKGGRRGNQDTSLLLRLWFCSISPTKSVINSSAIYRNVIYGQALNQKVQGLVRDGPAS